MRAINRPRYIPLVAMTPHLYLQGDDQDDRRGMDSLNWKADRPKQYKIQLPHFDCNIMLWGSLSLLCPTKSTADSTYTTRRMENWPHNRVDLTSMDQTARIYCTGWPIWSRTNIWLTLILLFNVSSICLAAGNLVELAWQVGKSGSTLKLSRCAGRINSEMIKVAQHTQAPAQIESQ